MDNLTSCPDNDPNCAACAPTEGELAMNDYWVDGHHVTAEHEDDARAWVRVLYGHEPETVRPWTNADEEN